MEEATTRAASLGRAPEHRAGDTGVRQLLTQRAVQHRLGGIVGRPPPVQPLRRRRLPVVGAQEAGEAVTRRSVRIDEGARAIDDHLDRDVSQPGGQLFDVGRAPTQTTASGWCASAQAPDRARRSKPATVVGPGRRQPLSGSASTGHPSACRDRGDDRGLAAPARHDHAASTGQLLHHSDRRRHRDGLVPWGAVGSACGQRRRLAQQRFREREVQVDGARPGSRRIQDRPGGQRAPRPRGLLPGHARLDHGPHGPAVEAGLVDGLRGPHAVELRRSVRRAGQQGHTRQVGLDHGGVQLDRRRAAGRHHHRGTAGRQPEAEGQESRGPLVDVHVHPDALVPGQRHGQRRRPGPGSDHGIGDATPGELVDQGGAERRSHRRLVHGPGL